ncbi:MAG: CGNR zinc finger domain-containing protein [Solirubrobacterales bacterium]|nr:CGNR zinc finger domain-containing protein [Solirubrobacterales bacterium]
MVARNPFDPGRQPGGRPPAPGRLALVQAYGNAFWDLDAGGVDEWADLAAYRAWLAARGFGATAAEEDRAAAIAIREALRDLARANHDDAPPPPAALAILDRAGATARIRFGAEGAVHEALGEGHAAATGLVLAVVAEAMADGTWSRLKACPGPHCGWMFYDASRNRSSHWCSMRICGNRVKGQAFRARQRAA